MNKHILLIGLNFHFRQDTGDKNFWVNLIPLLSDGLERITIFSIRQHDKNEEYFKIKNCEIIIKYFSPKILETPNVKYSRKRIFWKKGAFPSGIGILEKLLNIKDLIKQIKQLNEKYKITHIHLMDNLGFANRIIGKLSNNLGITVSVSAMSYQGKNPLIYHPYLKMSYNSKYLTIVPYSQTYKRKLQYIGVKRPKIKHIPWGVLPNISLSMNKSYYKSKLNLPLSKTLFLWAGYIQQIKKKDFLYAMKYAYKFLKKETNCIFYFAFKPESFEDEFLNYNNPDLGIHVKPTTIELFNDLKNAADVFYSLISNKNCIVAPPLTWIEMMNLGVPILTNNVPGASEIVENGKNGYLINHDNELIEKMTMISKNSYKMRKNCPKKVEKDYNIIKIANEYLSLFLKGRKELL